MERVRRNATADSLGVDADARPPTFPQLPNRRLNVSASVQSRASVNRLSWPNSGSMSYHVCDKYALEFSIALSIEWAQPKIQPRPVVEFKAGFGVQLLREDSVGEILFLRVL